MGEDLFGVGPNWILVSFVIDPLPLEAALSTWLSALSLALRTSREKAGTGGR